MRLVVLILGCFMDGRKGSGALGILGQSLPCLFCSESNMPSSWFVSMSPEAMSSNSSVPTAVAASHSVFSLHGEIESMYVSMKPRCLA